jgi:hypothetical protein
MKLTPEDEFTSIMNDIAVGLASYIETSEQLAHIILELQAVDGDYASEIAYRNRFVHLVPALAESPVGEKPNFSLFPRPKAFDDSYLGVRSTKCTQLFKTAIELRLDEVATLLVLSNSVFLPAKTPFAKFDDFRNACKNGMFNLVRALYFKNAYPDKLAGIEASEHRILKFLNFLM